MPIGKHEAEKGNRKEAVDGNILYDLSKRDGGR